MARTFSLAPAKRERQPLRIGIVAPSGAGKTRSALRLADGIARVIPGETAVIDTEAGRAGHYASEHRFMHLKFTPPFDPMSYVEAMKACIGAGASTIIVDSMSHEWEGEGGILEMHEADLERMAESDWKKRERMQMAAWIRPKAIHNKMKQFIVQQTVNFIFCFRAKEKIKPVLRGEPLDLGWQPLGAEDLIYEMDASILLPPRSDGVPTWTSEKLGEKQLTKQPQQFRQLFAQPRQLDEDIGEALARWAMGGDAVLPGKSTAKVASKAPAVAFDELIAKLSTCLNPSTLEELEARARSAFRALTKDQQAELKMAIDHARKAVAEAATMGDVPLSEEEQAEILRQEASQG